MIVLWNLTPTSANLTPKMIHSHSCSTHYLESYEFMIRRGTEAVDSIQSIIELYRIWLLLSEQQLVQSPEY